MEQDIQQKELLPKEKYSFKYSADEMKRVHKKYLKPAITAFIIIACCLPIITALWIFGIYPDVFFGVMVGICLLYIIIYARAIISFRKTSAALIKNISMREYVYTVFDDRLKTEIYDRDIRTSEEVHSFSEIQGVKDIGTHFLIVIAGKIFVVRKSEIPDGSYMLDALDTSMKKANKARKTKKILLIIFSAVFVVGLMLIAIGI